MTPSRRKDKGKNRVWLMPQEIEVWYVIPALRREITNAMIRRGLQQKIIAQVLGVTEPAITQYKLYRSKRSRGDRFEISSAFLPEVEKATEQILEAYERKLPASVIYEMMTKQINHLIRVLRDTGALCEFHRRQCTGIPADCQACSMTKP